MTPFIDLKFNWSDFISALKVLTAGHCIVKQIQIPFGNNVFVANVTPNEYYPTIESMYTVYLGIQNYTSAIYTAQNIPDGGQKMAVSKVIPVSENNFRFFIDRFFFKKKRLFKS